MKCDQYMGMDVHQATTVVVVLDVEGQSDFGDDRGDRSGSDHSIDAESEWTTARDV